MEVIVDLPPLLDDERCQYLDSIIYMIFSSLLSELRHFSSALCDQNPFKTTDLQMKGISASTLKQKTMRFKSGYIALHNETCLILQVIRSGARNRGKALSLCRQGQKNLFCILLELWPIALDFQSTGICFNKEVMVEIILGVLCNCTSYDHSSKKSLYTSSRDLFHHILILATRLNVQSQLDHDIIQFGRIQKLSFLFLRIMSLPDSPARGILATASICNELISSLQSALKFSTLKKKNNDSLRKIWNEKLSGGIMLLVNASIGVAQNGGNMFVVNEWEPLSTFLDSIIQAQKCLSVEIHSLALLLIRNMCLIRSCKLEILRRSSWVSFMLKQCSSSDEEVQKSAIGAIWCLMHKSENAVALVRTHGSLKLDHDTALMLKSKLSGKCLRAQNAVRMLLKS